MTISTTAISKSYSGNGSTHSFAYDFKIFADADLTIIIRSSTGTETVKTLNTHYIVTGAGVSSGGTILFKFNTGNASDAHYSVTDQRPQSGETVVIRSELANTQTLDLVPNDPFPADTLETNLDKLVRMIQQHDEELERSLKISRTNTMTSTEFTNSATDRANKLMAFDSAGEIVVTQEIGTFKGNWAASTAYAQRDIVKDTSTNNIFIVNTAHTSSGSQPLTTNANSAKYSLLVDAASATTSQNAAATSATAAANSATASANSATAAANSLSTFQNQYHGASSSDPTSNLDAGDLYFNTSSGIKVYNGSAFEDIKPTSSEQTNINTVAGIAANVTTVAGLNATHLSNVSGQATNIGNLGPISSDITSVANIASDVTSLANSLEKTYTVTVANVGGSNVFVLDGSNYPAIEMFRGNTYIFNQTDATNDGHPLVFKNGSSAYETGVTYFLNGSSATQSNYVNVTTFNAGRSSGNRQVQIEVASTAPSSGLRYYCYIHGNGMGNTITVKDSNVSLVAGSIANVNATAGGLTNINTVAGAISNINTVAGINSDVTSVASNTSNINSAVSNASNINSAVSNASNINSAVSNASNINTVAGSISNVNAVGAAITNVNNVGGSISNVNTVASNLTGVNSFADRYRIASSAPTSSLDIGDLYFDTTANELKVYKSSGWAAAGSTVNGTSARFTYNISGTPTQVTGADANGNTLAYDAGFVDVFLNGVKQVNGTDVTVTSGDTVTFASALANGDVVDIVGFGTFNVAAVAGSAINSGTINLDRLPTITNAKLQNSSITINGSAVALGGSVTVEQDFTWEIKTSSFTAAASRGYFVDTSSAAVTATLPSSATLGDTIRFVDHAAAFDTNNLTVARNSHKIQGDASDMTVATERAGFALVYVNATQGWVLMEK